MSRGGERSAAATSVAHPAAGSCRVNSKACSWPTAATIAALGLCAFLLLAVRFSPNWIAFYDGLREVRRNDPDAAHQAAIEGAILSGHSNRGLYVIRQSRDLSTEIGDPNHKIVRWRLLVPFLGHFLRLPGWLTLGLAHLGCVALIMTFVAIGSTRSVAAGRTAREGLYLGLVAGASAPFFTSMGWLGYYDSWLALGLVGVAFGRSRWLVGIACVLAPWIDERFVIGLPLALWVRRIQTDPPPKSEWDWFEQQSLLPVLLVCGYAAIRVKLGGTGGSQTVGEYLAQFVFFLKIDFTQRVYGAWAGLRLGWVLIAVAILGMGRAANPARRVQARLLAVGTVVTGMMGLFTALDLSRSMVLLIPVVVLGWMVASRAQGWGRFHVGAMLAIFTLVLPAYHVVGRTSVTVDNGWTPSLPLLTAQNNLGRMYETGDGVARDGVEAVRWYRKAAERGSADAQTNLGAMYAKGDGVAKNDGEAEKWYRLAAKQGMPEAQNNLGAMYASGRGLAKDGVEAIKWYRRAAEQGYAVAQSNLGMMYAQEEGVGKDAAEAVRWYWRAADQGYAAAQNNLGIMYADGRGWRKMAPRRCGGFGGRRRRAMRTHKATSARCLPPAMAYPRISFRPMLGSASAGPRPPPLRGKTWPSSSKRCPANRLPQPPAWRAN